MRVLHARVNQHLYSLCYNLYCSVLPPACDLNAFRKRIIKTPLHSMLTLLRLLYHYLQNQLIVNDYWHGALCSQAITCWRRLGACVRNDRPHGKLYPSPSSKPVTCASEWGRNITHKKGIFMCESTLCRFEHKTRYR